MKALSSILLIASILGIHTHQSFTYLLFKVNQQYIASTLCVEKEIENSSCAGSCYLKEQLAESKSEEDSGFPTSLLTEEFLRVAHNPTVLSDFSLKMFCKSFGYFDLQDNYSYLFTYKILRPPIV